jgi:hypothetical protein
MESEEDEDEAHGWLGWVTWEHEDGRYSAEIYLVAR